MQSSKAVVCLSHSSDLKTEPSGEQQEDTLCGDKNQTGRPVGRLVPRESGSQKSTFHSKQSLSADLSLSLEVSGHTKSLTAAREAKVWEEESSSSTSWWPSSSSPGPFRLRHARQVSNKDTLWRPLLHASCLTSNKPAGLSESPLLSVPVWSKGNLGEERVSAGKL